MLQDFILCCTLCREIDESEDDCSLYVSGTRFALNQPKVELRTLFEDLSRLVTRQTALGVVDIGATGHASLPWVKALQFRLASKRSRSRVLKIRQKLWPQLLCSASRAFDITKGYESTHYDYFSSGSKTPRAKVSFLGHLEAIHLLLNDFMGEFVTMMESRTKIGPPEERRLGKRSQGATESSITPKKGCLRYPN